VSLNKEDAHAFIQMINGNTGQTQYFRYDLSDFHVEKNKLDVRVGDSRFTRDAIDLNIAQNDMIVSGRLAYHGLSPFPGSLLSPGIMGWYSFVPRMECKHGVVSANHQVEGHLKVNGDAVAFDGAKGYIEKDWGISFPKAWIWVQCNSFNTADLSVMLSIAHIPWMGSYFAGFIGFVYYNGKYNLFSTYNGAQIDSVQKTENGISVTLHNKKLQLQIRVMQKQTGALKAPELGIMSRFIKESLDSDIHVTLNTRSGKVLIDEAGRRAGYEIVEEIFDYL
jgi:hypothetical protein